MSRYEVEPNVFYEVRGGHFRNESVGYKRGDVELVVQLSEGPISYDGYHDETQTTINIYTIKEQKGLLNKLRKKMNKEPLKDKERVTEPVEISRTIDEFLQEKDKSKFIKNEAVRKLVEEACGVIVEKGRPAHKEHLRQQDEIRKAEYKARDEAIRKEQEQKDLIATKKINDFFNDGK